MTHSPRISQAGIDQQFLDRWSPRAFSTDPVPETMIQSLFEAARWAPSCSNEQPWLFLYARTEEDLKLFRSLLVDGSRVWADRAPLLIFVLARWHFDHNNTPNDWAEFDTGAAWFSLALQARKLGLFTHAMAGFHHDKAYEILKVPRDRFKVVCAIAAGFYGDPKQLTKELARREHPNQRKSPADVAREGLFTSK